MSSWQGPVGLVVPRLTATPRVKGLAGGSRTRAQLALALLDAEIAPVALWNGDAESFARCALAQWISDRQGDAIAQRFEMHAFLSRGLGEYAGEDYDDQPLYLCVEPTTASYLRLGSAYRWLEQQDPQLPATVDSAIGSLNACVHVYGHHEAEEWREMRLDGMDEEDLRGLELPDLKVPESLRRRPLSAQRIARTKPSWPLVAQRVGEQAAEVRRLAERFSRRWPYHSRVPEALRMDLSDLGSSLPAVLASIEEHDLIEASFDDQSQYMYETEPEPSQMWVIQDITPASVRRAFDGLADWLEVMAAAASLFNRLPGQGKYAFDGGLPLMDILAAEEAA